jgi:hypothetical protein
VLAARLIRPLWLVAQIIQLKRGGLVPSEDRLFDVRRDLGKS